MTLGDFAGRVVLLNFWATWCAPCVREMPALDRLQAALAERGLKVVAVSEDRGGLEQVAPFYRAQAIEALDVYLDPEGMLRRAFEIAGLPTSFLIDAESRVVGELRGTAAWDGPEARALIGHYLE